MKKLSKKMEEKSENSKTSKPVAEKKAKKVKDPLAPKKPRSAYMLFCEDARAELKTTHPALTFGEVNTKISEMWKMLDDAGRKVCDHIISSII